MKIRITKKGLPKAQWLVSQPGVQMQMPAIPRQPWMMTFEEKQFLPLPKTTVVKTDGTQTTTGNFGEATKLYETSNQGTAEDQGDTVALKDNKFNPLNAARNFSNVMNAAAFSAGLLDNQRRNKEIERAYRESLVSLGPMDYTQNRGDYEINTGMVDPYNTGAKSKGQFTNMFYTPQFEIGGVSLGPLSYSDQPVRRNIDVYPDLLDGAFFKNETPPPVAPSTKKSNFKSSGVNPLAKSTWQDVSSQYPGVKFLGIWGDKRHQKTDSDHNTGDALDIGITGVDQGNQIAQRMIKEAADRNVKYIIWNRQIWNPSESNSWRPYKGKNPHTTHVHVSFNRSATKNSEDLGQISYTHNNPLNIHQGPFATKYGGKQGAKDGNGFVSIFPDMNTGIQAAKDLLFGPNYNTLTIEQARNKWVKGNIDEPSESTPHIIKAMGGNKKISQLTPAERDALIKEFARWEGKQAYTKIKDMQLFADGGFLLDDENNDLMKIRILQSPVQSMEYGGQSGYGFDLGARRVYTDMPESQSEMVNNTMGPVPREMATIEAEKGETILSDVDGDGMKEHMTIGGKRHSQGGTPLAAQPGDFIFSDTKKMKMKNPQLLAMFGKSMKAGGYTPAAIAKQYDINKYKAILQDPNADRISKRTAEMMIDNYEKKLGLLAYVQEAKKGFPQGIPEISQELLGETEAAYGGYIPEMAYGGYLEKYQTAGTVKKVKKEEIGNYEKQGYTRVGNTNVWRKPGTSGKDVKDIIVTPGSSGTTTGGTSGKIIPGKTITGGSGYKAPAGCANLLYTPEDVKARPGCYNTFLNKNGFKDASEQEMKEGLNEWKLGRRPTYQKGTPGTTVDPIAETKKCPDGYTQDPNDPTKCIKEWNTPPDEITLEDGPVVPSVGTYTSTGSKIPYGWTQQDINNLGLAAMNRAGIKKYSSVRRDFNPVLSDFRNMDWRGRAAELQGTYNSQLDAMGTYQSPTSLAANASFMAGQQSENLINRAIDPIEQANVNIYNQVEGQNAALMNQAIANAAQNRFLRSQDRAVLNQQYDNAVRQANTALTQTINQGLTNAAGIYNTNISESPYYFYNPRSLKMQFNSPQARAEFEAMRRNAGPNDNDAAAQYLATYEKFKGLPEDQRKAAMEFIYGNKGAKTSTTVYPNNPRLSRNTVQQPMIPAGYNPYIFDPAMFQAQ